IERFPRVRFILPHAGGLAPYFAWRLSVSPMIDPRLPQLARAQVYAGFKHFWYDNALSPGEQTFGARDHVALPERGVFRTDCPLARRGLGATAPPPPPRPPAPAVCPRPPRRVLAPRGGPRTPPPPPPRPAADNRRTAPAVPRTPSLIDQATASPNVSGDDSRSC